MYDEPRGIDFSQNKITSQNDPIRSLGLARLRSPINPEEWMIAVSQQYPADGRAAILHSFLALVHKSGHRRISSIGSKCLCDQITFGHAQLGHFVERQATDQCLRALRFQ